MDDAFAYAGEAFELTEGGATVFEVEEYLLLDGFVKLLEGATVGGWTTGRNGTIVSLPS